MSTYLFCNFGWICCWKIYFVDQGAYGKARVRGQSVVCNCLGLCGQKDKMDVQRTWRESISHLDSLPRVHNQQCPLAGSKRSTDLVTEEDGNFQMYVNEHSEPNVT